MKFRNNFHPSRDLRFTRNVNGAEMGSEICDGEVAERNAMLTKTVTTLIAEREFTRV